MMPTPFSTPEDPRSTATGTALRLALLGLSAVVLHACASTPEPEPEPEPVEVILYEPEPEPVPTITYEEWLETQEGQAQTEAEEAAAAALAQAEADRIAAEEAAAAAEAERAAARAARAAALAARPPLERAADEDDPDAKIAILAEAEDSEAVMAARTAAYRAKLAADREAGDTAGQADAMIYLAGVEAASGGRDAQLSALRQYRDAQTLDPSNTAAAAGVSEMRGALQSYADQLHEEALALFVAQDFEPAAERWETVLLIDPANTAAQNWYSQISTAPVR